jgi:hypothetical protein
MRLVSGRIERAAIRRTVDSGESERLSEEEARPRAVETARRWLDVGLKNAEYEYSRSGRSNSEISWRRAHGEFDLTEVISVAFQGNELSGITRRLEAPPIPAGERGLGANCTRSSTRYGFRSSPPPCWEYLASACSS